jgi:hypothetical protein
MTYTDTNGHQYYEFLDEVKADGLYPLKVISLLCFFRLKGRTSIINMDNIEPLFPVKYLLFSKAENKLYLKDYKGYELKELFDTVYSGNDPFINNLAQWVADGNIYLLFDKKGIDDMKTMLQRIWNVRFSDSGKLEYVDFLRLLKSYIDIEEYKDYGKGLPGFKTVCNQYDQTIRTIWDEIHKKGKKTIKT